MFIYGELDLRFLPELTSAPLIISIVKMAMEDKNLRYLNAVLLYAFRSWMSFPFCSVSLSFMS